MSDDDMTTAAYRAEITSTAETIIEEVHTHGGGAFGTDEFEETLTEVIWETADSHQWIIYSGYHLDILQHSESDPDDWLDYVDPDRENDHRHVLQAMAFTAFYRDLSHETFRRYQDMTEGDTPDGNRNYTDAALRLFVADLDDNERAGLQYGMLPVEPFGDIEPPLANGDVAEMMRRLDD